VPGKLLWRLAAHHRQYPMWSSYALILLHQRININVFTGMLDANIHFISCYLLPRSYATYSAPANSYTAEFLLSGLKKVVIWSGKTVI